MKTFYTFILGMLLFTPFHAQAQTTITFIQETGGLWSFPGHWSGGMVPTAQDDVIIPSDTALDVDINAQCRSIIVQDRAEMDIDMSLTVGGGTFEAGSTIDWVTGTINITGASTGVLTVQGQLNVTSDLPKFLRGNTLRIESEMNIVDAVNNIEFTGGILQVAPAGVLNIEGELDFFTSPTFPAGILDNQGTINRTSGAGTMNFNISYVQNGGTLNLDFGSIRATRPATISGGVLNVNENGFFEMASSNSNFISGEIIGQLDGPVIFNGSMRTRDGNDAILNFSGPAGVEFIGGNLNQQGSASSAFVNQGLFIIKNVGDTQPPFMGSNAILRNEGLIVFDESVDFFILNQSATIENTNNGTITLVNDTDIFGPILNSGLIQKTGGTGVIEFTSLTNNEDGVFDITSGGVDFSSTFQGKGVITGIGSFETDGSDVVESVIAPGNDGTGTLTFENDLEFDSTEDCVYQLELNGTTPDTEHDVFAINAPAKLNGIFDIQLGFAPQINDEFVVITATNITQCNLPAQVSATFDGMAYTYDVVCNATNVTLKVVSATLGEDDEKFAFAKAYPNPSQGNLTIQLDQKFAAVNTTIRNMLGQVVAVDKFTNKDVLRLNIPGSAGIYFITIQDEFNQTRILKIIKE